MKSLEVSEEKANQRVEEFKKQLKTLTTKLKEAEARAEYAEKTVKKLQKEVDRLEGILIKLLTRIKINSSQILKRSFIILRLTIMHFKIITITASLEMKIIN